MTLYYLIAAKMSINLYIVTRRARLATIELLLAACALFIVNDCVIATNNNINGVSFFFGDSIISTTVPQSQQLVRHNFAANQLKLSSNNNNQIFPSFAATSDTRHNQKQQNYYQNHYNINQNQNLSSIAHLTRLEQQLNVAQAQLVRQHPGSLKAVARAISMAIAECKHQTRHEVWDCPVMGFGARPSDIFGKLAAQSFKETSFIRSLLASAIAHSVARACTESQISTCSRSFSRDGSYSENVEFGSEFAEQFMKATNSENQHPNSIHANSFELPLATVAIRSSMSPSYQNTINSPQLTQFDASNSIVSLAVPQLQQQQTSNLKTKDEFKRRVNEHNDIAGVLVSLI